MPRDRFNPAQAQEVAVAFADHQVDYMFIGKSGAILLGYPGTTQDVELYPRKDFENGIRIVAGLGDLGFLIDDRLEEEIISGKDFIQIKSGPLTLTWCLLLMGSRAMRKPRVVWTSQAAFQS